MVKNQNQNPIKKICYSGRLDPMARGKVLLLFNDECKKLT
jgi:tRNA U55 pseudouridine synthase TruB